MFKRKKHLVPSLSTTSTADISFMLLIFFLVTSSMDVDKGLSRMLPPIEPEENQTEATDIEERNILRLSIAPDDALTCNDEPMQLSQLRPCIEKFVGQTADRQKHVIQIDAHRDAHYDIYFQVQNEIVAAYRHLREQQARRQYGKHFEQCTAEEKDALRAYYPQRIAEVNHSADQSQEGGNP